MVITQTNKSNRNICLKRKTFKNKNNNVKRVTFLDIINVIGSNKNKTYVASAVSNNKRCQDVPAYQQEYEVQCDRVIRTRTAEISNEYVMAMNDT